MDKLRRLLAWAETHRNLTAFILIMLGIVPTGLAITGLLSKPATAPKSSVVQQDQPPEPPKPEVKTSLLTGVPLEGSLQDRPVTAVVIENHPAARPQSGLGEAGVVYEALAEGGITRFLSFFQETRPALLGPVRSLRTYFVSWTLEFDAAIAHVGGNADALDLVVPMQLKDMSQFSYPAHFYRTRDRFSPHNMYTTSDLMDQLMVKLNNFRPPAAAPTPRKDDTTDGGVNAGTIDLTYSFAGYAVQYRFDRGCNCYLRFMAGSPHIDRNTGQQIRVKNIVVEYMPTAFGVTRIGEQTVRMGDSGLPIGSNKAVVFRDGIAIEGTWNKPDHRARTKLLDASGKEIPLNRGNTWYSIIPIGKSATWR
jgi:hypothetical protein